MNVSVICACKNREAALKISLTSWLNYEEIKEIIIVDWDSDKPIDYLCNLDPRVKIIRVPDKKYFNQPQPLNLAAGLASFDYILKLDVDYVMNPYYNFFENYLIDDNTFVSGKCSTSTEEFLSENEGTYNIDKDKMTIDEIYEYCNTYSPYYKYLTGLLFIKKDNFYKVGGYNENLGRYYAFEDDELYGRLELFGLNHKKMNYDHNFFHIPHQDSKRTENFEGFDLDKEQNDYIFRYLSDRYQGEELKWQAEYAISTYHVKRNKETVGNSGHFFVEPKTKWKLQKISDSHFLAKIKENSISSKFENFPTAYYVTLEESTDRQNYIESQFKKFNINFKSIKSKRFAESDDKVFGRYLHSLNDGTKGCCISHLKAIRDWYQTTDEPYGFFCEDDLSFDTVDYWNFNWSDFVKVIPEDAECIQLFTIRSDYDTFDIRERYWDDWGATAYIITRNYAEKIISTFIKADGYHLELPNSTAMPLIENILFSSVGKTYTIPLFTEEIKFESTFVGRDDDVNDGQKTNHKKSRDVILNYWKSISLKKDVTPVVEKTELETLLERYSLDTENPENNFALGIWYENEGHTAPALSYFLRCAERSCESNPDLAYESLIRGSYCYKKQGTRDGSTRSMLWQAQAFRTDRPEAYYLLSKFAEKNEWWQDCYLNADLALRYCNFDCPPLLTDIGYPGKHGLLFEKAISGWWWGKSNECKSILLDILENYEISEEDRRVIGNTITKMGGTPPANSQSIDFSYPENFDWSSLTYEDIVTIDREIVHEKVYRFWQDVKKDDVVLDIGASVGAYAISILGQNPKKVYCVEPSKKLLNTLIKNCSSHPSLVDINYGIVDKKDDKINIFGGDEEFNGITFKDLIEKYSIPHVNFMKIDCEGGEYNIFKDENMNFLKNSVDFIAMEIHLNYEGCREKFKNFRNKYLTQFNDYKVMSCTRQNISWGNSIDIKDRLFDDEFIDNYTCEFMIYIKNR